MESFVVADEEKIDSSVEMKEESRKEAEVGREEVVGEVKEEMKVGGGVVVEDENVVRKESMVPDDERTDGAEIPVINDVVDHNVGEKNDVLKVEDKLSVANGGQNMVAEVTRVVAKLQNVLNDVEVTFAMGKDCSLEGDSGIVHPKIDEATVRDLEQHVEVKEAGTSDSKVQDGKEINVAETKKGGIGGGSTETAIKGKQRVTLSSETDGVKEKRPKVRRNGEASSLSSSTLIVPKSMDADARNALDTRETRNSNKVEFSSRGEHPHIVKSGPRRLTRGKLTLTEPFAFGPNVVAPVLSESAKSIMFLWPDKSSSSTIVPSSMDTEARIALFMRESGNNNKVEFFSQSEAPRIVKSGRRKLIQGQHVLTKPFAFGPNVVSNSCNFRFCEKHKVWLPQRIVVEPKFNGKDTQDRIALYMRETRNNNKIEFSSQSEVPRVVKTGPRRG
ncbi:hypothetical protein HDU76_003389 [Blyttiomyces sp. JEL0837]|nr:hypothetical protein HDU76_003389 [Blyttiomyces sp. JEL0837]